MQLSIFTKEKLRIKYEKNTTWFRVDKATLIYFYSLQIHRRYILEIKKFYFFLHEFYLYFICQHYDIFMIIFKIQFTNDFVHISYDIHSVISVTFEYQTSHDHTIGDIKQAMFNTLALWRNFFFTPSSDIKYKWKNSVNQKNKSVSPKVIFNA